MKSLFPSLLLVLALVLSSCETNNSGRKSNRSAGPVIQLPDPKPRQAFEMGISYGRSDRRRGLVPLPARHDARIPLRSRPEFARGYDRGYREAGWVRLREIAPPAPRIRF